MSMLPISLIWINRLPNNKLHYTLMKKQRGKVSIHTNVLCINLVILFQFQLCFDIATVRGHVVCILLHNRKENHLHTN